MIGSPRATAGTISAIVAALLTAPKTAIDASMYPMNMLPVSPIKMVAGLKL